MIRHLLLAPILLATLPQVRHQRLHRGRVQLTGPLTRVVLDLGSGGMGPGGMGVGGGRTVLEGPLLPGERRTLVVPLPGRGLGEEGPRVVPFPGPGGATFLGWVPDPTPDPPVPPALGARPRPPVQGSHPAVTLEAGLALAAAALVVLAARRRRTLVLGVGVVAAGAVVAVQVATHPPAGGAVLRVLEGLAPGDHWLQVDGAAGVLVCPDRGTLGVESDPPRAPLEWRVPLGDGGGGRGPWEVRLPGGALWRLATLDPGPRRLGAEGNRWGRMGAVWTRAPQGSWRFRGAWEAGAPLPPPIEGEAPPGWLASALPQGRGVLVARLAPDTWGGEGEGTWLRLVGFEPGESR